MGMYICIDNSKTLNYSRLLHAGDISRLSAKLWDSCDQRHAPEASHSSRANSGKSLITPEKERVAPCPPINAAILSMSMLETASQNTTAIFMKGTSALTSASTAESWENMLLKFLFGADLSWHFKHRALFRFSWEIQVLGKISCEHLISLIFLLHSLSYLHLSTPLN